MFMNIDFLENTTLWAQFPWRLGTVKFCFAWGRKLPKPEVETIDPQKLYETREEKAKEKKK